MNDAARDPAALGRMSDADIERITHDFALLYWRLRDQTFGRTRWMGVSTVKTPMDMLVLQEIVAETRPALIVETGVWAGGSTLYFANLLDLLEIDGKVIAIDVDMSAVSPHIGSHPKVELIEAGSLEPDVIERVRQEAAGRSVMVDLDANHDTEHVLAELRAYAPLVTPHCYLVVEDTWLGGRPLPEGGPGPGDALERWLGEGQPFEPDRWRERLLLTSNPRGYLRRHDPAGRPAGGPPRLARFAIARTERPRPGPGGGQARTVEASPAASRPGSAALPEAVLRRFRSAARRLPRVGGGTGRRSTWRSGRGER